MAELVGDVLGGTLLVPVVVGGIVVSVASSPVLRKRMRQWGVHGMAGAMAAYETAARELELAAAGTGGMMGQISRRVVQAAAELRKEWEDFTEEARQARAQRQGTATRRPRRSPAHAETDTAPAARPAVSRSRRRAGR